MAHYRVNLAIPRAVVESIVLDVPTPRAACERAAEWVLARFPGVLAGQMTLQDVRQIDDREACKPRKPRKTRQRTPSTWGDCDGRDFDNLGESPDY